MTNTILLAGFILPNILSIAGLQSEAVCIVKLSANGNDIQ